MKNPVTPAEIEPTTFRFVAQHLNHCATVVPVRVEACRNYRDPAVLKGVRDPKIFHIFVLLVARLLSILYIKSFRPNPINSSTDSQSFRFNVKIFSRSPLAGGSNFFFTGTWTRSQLHWAQIRSHARPYGILGGQTETGTCFSLRVSAFPCQHHSTCA